MKRILIRAALFAILVIAWMLQPQHTGNSQIRTEQHKPDKEELERARLLEVTEIETRKGQQKMSEVAELITEIANRPNKVARRPRRVTSLSKVPMEQKKVILRVGKLVYEPEVEEYKGYLIVDINLDSLREDTQPNGIYGEGIPESTPVWRKIDIQGGNAGETAGEERGFFRRLFQKRK